MCSSRWCFREHSTERKSLSTQNYEPPHPFSLSLRSVNIFFSHFFLYVRQTVTLPWYNQLWLLGGGGRTIRRPPTMAEILGFVGAKLKKSVPPSCTELSFRPSVRPPSKPRVSNLRTTHDVSAHRLACHKGLTNI